MASITCYETFSLSSVPAMTPLITRAFSTETCYSTKGDFEVTILMDLFCNGYYMYFLLDVLNQKLR